MSVWTSITTRLCCTAEHSLLLAPPPIICGQHDIITELKIVNHFFYSHVWSLMSAMRKLTPAQLFSCCVHFQRQRGLKYSQHTEFQTKIKNKWNPTLIKSLRSHARKGVACLQHKTNYGTISDGGDKVKKNKDASVCVCVWKYFTFPSWAGFIPEQH